MQQLNKSSHSTHTLNFHLIFCTKYRRTVLTNEIGDRVKEIIQEIAKEQNAIVEAIETQTDHVHVMLNLNQRIQFRSWFNFSKDVRRVLSFKNFHISKIVCGKVTCGAAVTSSHLPVVRRSKLLKITFSLNGTNRDLTQHLLN
jgi:REP element-mobilizing transposase RayT